MPKLVDLCCGAGGAGIGYSLAGFEVVGVDIASQPSYPFEFHRADALTFPLDGFDAIHASPPCQHATPLRHLHKHKLATYVDLIMPIRARLVESGVPYVIENVRGAALVDPVMLCGSMFGLGANGRQLRRHRYFECSFPVMQIKCQHDGQPVGVYGHGGGGDYGRGYKGTRAEYAEAMGMHGYTKAELAQAIPPAYTQWLAWWLLRALAGETRRVPA